LRNADGWHGLLRHRHDVHPRQGRGWSSKVPQTRSGPLLLSDYSTSEAHPRRRYFRLTPSDRFLDYISVENGNDAEDQLTDSTLLNFLCGETEERNDFNHDICRYAHHCRCQGDACVNFQPGEEVFYLDEDPGRVWIYSSLPCVGKPPMVVVTVQGALSRSEQADSEIRESLCHPSKELAKWR
jgi:hypothetical protein